MWVGFSPRFSFCYFFTRAALLSAAFLLLTSCALLPPADGRKVVDEDLLKGGFVEANQGTGVEQLRAMLRLPGTTVPPDVLTIYIEGDGAAWPRIYQPPTDPTPQNALVARLALADPAPAVAYLGRPCQYLEPQTLLACPVEFWTGHRFAETVVARMDSAVTQLKRQAGSSRVRLVGYSGGGVIAVLLTARRLDVDRVITLASPLSVAVWARHHKVSSLVGSLDPETVVSALPSAVHFLGAKDEVVPAAVVVPFVRRTGGRFVVVPEFDHRCCWLRDWQKLLEEAG